MQNAWRYYNHALIPTTAPHEPVDKAKMNLRVSGVLFARWTEEFDCNKKNLWWYVIKDTPFDIKDLKVKRRYKINKGLKNFDVKVINASEFAEELFEITFLAYAQYPAKYRPIIDREKFKKDISGWGKTYCFWRIL